MVLCLKNIDLIDGPIKISVNFVNHSCARRITGTELASTCTALCTVIRFPVDGVGISCAVCLGSGGPEHGQSDSNDFHFFPFSMLKFFNGMRRRGEDEDDLHASTHRALASYVGKTSFASGATVFLHAGGDDHTASCFRQGAPRCTTESRHVPGGLGSRVHCPASVHQPDRARREPADDLNDLQARKRATDTTIGTDGAY